MSLRCSRLISAAVRVVMCLVGTAGPVHAQSDVKPDYLCQGWSDEDRETFYFTSQGSQLLPYDWFLALEQATSEARFSCRSNMERLGFLYYPKELHHNRHGLPIGFVKDERDVRKLSPAKSAYLGNAQKDAFLMASWVGLTCAACHTGEIRYKQTVLRIDGGPAMADFETLLIELVDALEATHKDDEKLTRFAKRVLAEGGYSDEEREALRRSIGKFLPRFRQLTLRGRGTTPYGHGRLDAFGAILNEICETSLKIPANHHPADAPASYPVLWDTSKLDWVQWNGSAGNPLARNVGEVLGVFAHSLLSLDDAGSQFLSTAHIENLRKLEEVYIAKLRAPVWPEILGPLDTAKVEAGRRLYQKTCGNCHFVRDEFGRFPSLTIGSRKFIRTSLIPVDFIGTDSQLADNFVKRTADPGGLSAFLPPTLQGKQQVSRGLILKAAVGGIIRRYAVDNNVPAEAIEESRNFRPAEERPPNPWSYKARPLNGIWASAPFLHNGSVPTLYQLLLPANQRPVVFYVGNRTFDPKLVGFISTPSDDAFRFRVLDELGKPIIGNSNAGHSGRNFTHTLADDGSLREFTDAERWALIEYVKSLR